MNGKQWKYLCKNNVKSVNFTYYHRVRKIQKSLKYNNNVNANVIHHLRDTEEQRKYNDEHYELWGFEIDENGNEIFNYGKYVVFWTKEQHDNYHARSEETRKKISESIRALDSEERRNKISIATRLAMTDEAKHRCSESHKGLRPTDETRKKMSDSHKAIVNDDFRNKMSKQQKERMTDQYKDHLSDKITDIMNKKRELYRQYRENGGALLWNDFQKYIKENNLLTK